MASITFAVSVTAIEENDDGEVAEIKALVEKFLDEARPNDSFVVHACGLSTTVKEEPSPKPKKH